MKFVAFCVSDGKTEFQEWKKKGFATVGWVKDKSLADYTPAELAQTIDGEYREQKLAERSFAALLQVEVGDVVVVPAAQHGLQGVGIVTEAYSFNSTLSSYGRPHCIRINWRAYNLKREFFEPQENEVLWPTRGFAVMVRDEVPAWLNRKFTALNLGEAPNSILTPLNEEVSQEEVPAEVEDDFFPHANEPYSGDPFTYVDGHFIGDDGFVVPNNFEEFYQKNPNFVKQWARKHMHRASFDDDVLDCAQDMLMHLAFLPENSRLRRPGTNGRPQGCTDVVQTFNPIKQHGANARRFYGYLKTVFANRYNTIYSKHQKEPVSKSDTLGLIATTQQYRTGGDTDFGKVISDEALLSLSEYAGSSVEQAAKLREDKLLISEFTDYVKRYEPQLLVVMDAIANTRNLSEARASLRYEDLHFKQAKHRLQQLKNSFVAGEYPAKAYKTKTAGAGE